MSGYEDLYPFLAEGGGPAADPAPVLAAVRESTLRKAEDVAALRAAVWKEAEDELVRAAGLLADALRAGHKVLAFGNGGSATDARDLASDLTDPPDPEWAPYPAIDLGRDTGVVTAVGNDVGFESVFLRQVIAHGEPGDVAVGFSTSGESGNVLAAFRTARERGLRTVGFAGYDGGQMAELAAERELDAVIVARSSHIPRIQEAHATACHALLRMAHTLLREKEA